MTILARVSPRESLYEYTRRRSPVRGIEMAGPEDADGAQALEAQPAAATAEAAAADVEATAMETDDLAQPRAEQLSAPGSEKFTADAEAPAEDAAEPEGDPGSAPTARGRGRKARGALQAPARTAGRT